MTISGHFPTSMPADRFNFVIRDRIEAYIGTVLILSAIGTTVPFAEK
jgi:hypothetical protein